MRIDSWINFVRQHRANWGTWAFALWASVLAFLGFANMMLLLKVAEISDSLAGMQGQIWLIIVLNAIFGLGFAGSAYGLWRRRNWGRVLFLWLVVVWSVANMAALFTAGSGFASGPVYPAADRVLKGLRFTVGPIVALWYFNLARVKDMFLADGPENFGTEELSKE